MGKKDTAITIWCKNKERFADLFNGTVFRGEQIVQAEELEIVDSKFEEILSDNYGRISDIKRYRDIIMCWKKEVNLVLLTCENQDKIHYAMPIRAMIYDGLTYLEQIRHLSNKKKNKVVSSEEFLSGITKEEHLNPIIPLVVYYGEKEWDAPTDIYGMIGKSKLENEFYSITDLVPNYKINLLDISQLKETQRFKTDLQIVFRMLQYKENKNELFKYIRENEDFFRGVDIETYNVIRVLLNSQKQFKEIRKLKNQERSIDMCKALEEFYNEGVELGINQGIQAFVEVLKELCIPKDCVVEKLIEKFSIDEDDAQACIEMYWK